MEGERERGRKRERGGREMNDGTVRNEDMYNWGCGTCNSCLMVFTYPMHCKNHETAVLYNRPRKATARR